MGSDPRRQTPYARLIAAFAEQGNAEIVYSASMSFTLAHLSDVHLGPLPRLGPRHWNAKRALGFLNWHRSRKRCHLAATLDAILADLEAQQPDHIAVTGDLVNIGLPAEYVAAEAWLRGLGDPERVTVVPGNHDIYTTLRADPGVGRWQAYMTSTANGATLASFPFVRRFGPIALIGLNSAVPMPPLQAGGRLGAAQLQRLGRLLDRLGGEGATRVVLIHHPPLPGLASPRKALEDAAELQAMLAAHGAELALHGHNHCSMINECRSGSRAIPVVGVPSASLGRPQKDETLARYHLYRFASSGPDQPIELIARGLAQPGGPVIEIGRRTLGALPIAAR